MISISSLLNIGPLNAYPLALQEQLRELLIETSYFLRQELEYTAPVLSGALSQSFYVVNQRENTYGAAAAGFLGRRPDMEALPEIPVAVGDDSAQVGTVAPYWYYVEYGTSNAGAQPFVIPAIAAARAFFATQAAIRSINAGLHTGWTT